MTHWGIEGQKSGIDSEAFYDKYLSDYKHLDIKKFSFYIGYYIHLLTDKEFHRQVYGVKQSKYKEKNEETNIFLVGIRKDWVDIDYLYIKDHPDFYIFKIFSQIGSFPNEYLEYYSQTSISNQIKSITNFYQSFSGELEREYVYSTKEEIDNFIVQGCENIQDVLIKKGLMI